MVLEDTILAPWDHCLSRGLRPKMDFYRTHRTFVPSTGTQTPSLWASLPGEVKARNG